MRSQGFYQSCLAEFLAALVERLSNAIGVDRKDVAGEQLPFRCCAVLLAEQSHDGRRCIEAFHGTVHAEQQSGEVSAVHVPQAPRLVVEL